LRVWNAADGRSLASFRASTKPISACAVSPDGHYYLSACLHGFLAHWHADSHEKAAFFLAHWRPISSISFGHQGKMLATASWDKNLILWDLSQEQGWRTLSGHDDIVAGCCYTPDGGQLLSWSHDGSLGLWDVAQAALIHAFEGHGDRVTSAALSADGQLAASGSRDRTLRLWSLEEKRQLGCCSLAGEIRGCFFLPDRATLLALDAEGCLSVHRLPDLQQERELLTEQQVVVGALAPDGRKLALGCADGRMRLVAIEGVEPFVPAPARSGQRKRLTQRVRKLLRLPV
jgi:WD domain, G-beta repeat